MEPDEIGLRDIDRIRVPQTSYVGNDMCRVCHQAAYEKWLATAHSRAFVPMRSMMAMMMGEQAGVTACCPAKSGKCLRCHGTAHDIPAAYRGTGVRMGEGVTCEKCHGPGGEHVKLARSSREGETVEAGALSASLEKPPRCLSCHLEKKSHEAMERSPYDEKKAWLRIAHPTP